MCSACGKELPLCTGFYLSKSPIFAIDQRINICKECFISNALDERTGEIDEDKLKNILRKTDYPYYRDVLQSAVNQYARKHNSLPPELIKYHGKDIVSIYMKNINSLPQLSGKTYLDSDKDGFVQQRNTVLANADDQIEMIGTANARRKAREDKCYLDGDNFKLTDDIIQLFGEGFTKTEYRKMHEKYEKLKLNYTLQTNIHQEALATYVRFKVKEEDATAKGRVDEAKKWYDAAQNAAEKAKLTPRQLKKEDFQKGLNSFSEISQALEQAVDIIEILPRYKNQPGDSVDFNIWCYINYARKLKGLPTVDYSEVYQFYDDMKNEYISQYGDPYGIFTDDTTVKNRENVKRFITLPKDYEDFDDNVEIDDNAIDTGEVLS